jgi:hypothetical protein
MKKRPKFVAVLWEPSKVVSIVRGANLQKFWTSKRSTISDQIIQRAGSS